MAWPQYPAGVCLEWWIIRFLGNLLSWQLSIHTKYFLTVSNWSCAWSSFLSPPCPPPHQLLSLSHIFLSFLSLYILCSFFLPSAFCFPVLSLLSTSKWRQHNCLHQPVKAAAGGCRILQRAKCVCMCVIVWAYADGRASESGRAASHPSAVITIFPSASSPSPLTWSSGGLNPDGICTNDKGSNVCLLHKAGFFCVCTPTVCVSVYLCVQVWTDVCIPPLPPTVSSKH